GDMLSYNPRQYRCCQHNVAFGWPYFAEHLWLATADNGLAVTQYAPATVKAKVGHGAEVQIQVATDYPFDEAIEFRFTLEKKMTFPLWLRIPAWCLAPRLFINGVPLTLTTRPLSWVMLKRVWQHQDVVRLELPMSIQVLVWKSQQHAISVKRGPLYYSLNIGEGWRRVGGTDEWPAYEVHPTTPWNYGLRVDLQNPAASFVVHRSPARFAGQDFAPENAPIELRVKGRQLPAWKLETNGLIGNFQGSPVQSSEPLEELSLIPMGMAHLRVTVFPRLSDSPDANVWE
ncbi:glycoside hydrolase family 127 protein, partial [candidate division KSB1 bacterium]|nr:glycoside hydrolase family 127 protein [candidate division KSB1 bacterium]